MANVLKLELNPHKTKTSFYTTSFDFKCKPNICLNNVVLEKEVNPVYLGNILNTELRFGPHIAILILIQTKRRKN